MPPRVRNTDRGITSEGKEEEKAQSSQPSSSRKRGLRNRISAACEACKKRKTKCTGEPLPCHLCEVLGTECVIDLSQDMRRREAMHQSLNEAKVVQEALNGLIDCLKFGDSKTIQALQEVFQQDGVSKEKIAAAIQYWTEVARNSSHNHDQIDHGSLGPTMQPILDGEAGTPSFEMVLDPLLMENPALDDESHTPTYLRDLLRRLRDCSEEEGLKILKSLLGVSSVGVFESFNTYQPDHWTND